MALTVSLVTILLIPRQAYDRPRVHRRGGRPPAPRRRLRLARLGPLGRIVERSATGFSSSIRSRPLRIIVALALAPVSLVTCFGALLITAIAAYDVVSSIATMQSSGMLDDLRLTVGDVTDGRRFAGQVFRAHLNRCMFYLLALAFTSGFMFFQLPMFCPFAMMMTGVFPAGEMLASDTPLILVALALVAFLIWFVISAVLQLWCLVAVSCYCATSKFSPVRQSVHAVAHLFLIRFFAGILAILVSAFFFRAFDIDMVYWEEWAVALGPVLFAVVVIVLYALLCHSYFRRFRRKFTKTVCLGQ